MKKYIVYGILVIVIAACQKQPLACFEADKTSIAAGDTIAFSSLCSENTHHYEWNFGDGTTSELSNPAHSYTTKGTFTVTLTAYSKNEKKTGNATKTITVN